LKRLVLWWIDSRAAPLPAVVAGGTGRALELGCAHGAYLEQLRQHGWNCVGVEPAADVAVRAAAKGFDVRVGSLEEVVQQCNQSLPDNIDRSTFASSSFDAVIAWMVVEHLHDPLTTLKLAHELLVPGGQFLFSVPNFGCWERSFFGRYWYALQLPTHLQHFRSTTLRQLLDASGLELVDLIHQRNVNNLVGSIGLWLRTTFPRWSFGTRLIRWTDNPSALGLCLLAPLGRVLALMQQAGRLTIVARRRAIHTAETSHAHQQ
jgi:SAM-dependent methyltransferase